MEALLRVRGNDRCKKCFYSDYPCLILRDGTKSACEGCYNVKCVWPIYDSSTTPRVSNPHPTQSQAYIDMETELSDRDLAAPTYRLGRTENKLASWSNESESDSVDISQLPAMDEQEQTNTFGLSSSDDLVFGSCLAADLGERLKGITRMIRETILTRRVVEVGSSSSRGGIDEAAMLEELRDLEVGFEAVFMRRDVAHQGEQPQ